MDRTHSGPLPDLETVLNESTPALRARYTELMGCPPPLRAGQYFLKANVAWAIQVIRQGKDPAVVRTELLNKTAYPISKRSATYKVGTRLIREWQGETYEVTVLGKGYRWQGQHYRSLSRIAQEITGTKWSGPRFFGLSETGA